MRVRDGWTLAGGRWSGGTGDETFTVTDPATGEPVGEVPVCSAADVEDAVAAAAAAAPGWAAVPAAERGAALHAAANAVEERADELAALVTSEMGKPADDSRGGVEAGIGTLRQYAELGPLHGGRSLQGGRTAADLMVREPRGVVTVITPWNDPVAIACGLIGAAVVTGNTVVHKPSERTPHTGALLAELLAGRLPDGVLNLVTGAAATGDALAAHPVPGVVAHVGSTRAGRRIAGLAARNGAKALLENGGTDPLIVDAGVDPGWAAGQAALGCFANAGQICTSVERVYVHESLHADFLDALAGRARAMRTGSGFDPSTELGPLVDERHRAQVHEHVEKAVADGARVLAGGEIPGGPGAFYPATVLDGCTDAMAIMTEETFGPVAPVRAVASFDEALDAARRARHGLAATVLTRDMAHARRAWRELPVGTVKVNAVFGGAPGGAATPRGASGEGFGYGPELLDEMTAVKVVHIETAP
ncbi:aldehyde dehydrogenase family protein [Actinomadura algeriensis]|uniref:Succinate-semialdehyde dehydrogenase/glutarate-semialdehyde dehydrogenase n=1 Tax=Actinomadura algeriensis TaxID=1679523 RepID=A0ABR9JZU4_9ACTN|nr:aldehyde dehydrogenase family protein [Actinomadura algeriensis]MBE1535993.1 succinate-semialdehyde dehydrogenase/glutarate-semialdehyde dehydrogenase [Actinomadura algeriensis]